jgi:hypothetical protein
LFYWIYDIPTEKLAALFAVVFVGFFWGGCILLRPILRQFVRARSDTNEIVGNVLSCFCVFYGLLLGLLAVAAYQNYSQVQTNVDKEATALTALYHDVASYPEPYGQTLRWLLRDYCHYVIKYAWPLQRQGIVPKGGEPRVSAFLEKLLAFQPHTVGEQIVHAEAIHQFNVFLEQRNERLQSVTTSIPPVMWYVVIVGAVINLVIVWLFEMPFITRLFLGGLLAFYLGAMIFLIAVMDNPFRGEVSVSSEDFETIYQMMMDDAYNR